VGPGPAAPPGQAAQPSRGRSPSQSLCVVPHPPPPTPRSQTRRRAQAQLSEAQRQAQEAVQESSGLRTENAMLKQMVAQLEATLGIEPSFPQLSTAPDPADGGDAGGGGRPMFAPAPAQGEGGPGAEAGGGDAADTGLRHRRQPSDDAPEARAS
jgi:hypothetical protein